MRALVALLVVACSVQNAPLFGQQDGSGVEPDARAGRRRSVRSPGVRPTSFALIDQAVQSGAISEETGTVYKVYTIFADPRLPEPFRGDDTALGDTLYLTEVAARYETLSPETQKIVRPFLIPPMHRASWFYHQPRPAAGAVTIAADQPCENCDEIGEEWAKVATRNGKAVVWFQLRYGGTEAAHAIALADEIDNVIWPRLTSFMIGREPNPDFGDNWLEGSEWGGDTRLDIALVDASDINTTLGHGVTRSVASARYFKSGCVGMAFIILKRGTPKQELAHELMHAFQYAHPVKVHSGDCSPLGEYRWLMEATAEWVKDAIPEYRSSNGEHFFAKFFLTTPDKSLNDFDPAADSRAYGAYLLPFFVTRIKSFTTAFPGFIWSAAEDMGSLDAVDSGLRSSGFKGFAEAWPEFALQNLNRPPLDDYDREDQLKDRVPIISRAMTAAPDDHAEMPLELPHLSAAYRHAAISPDARSFAFYNGYTFRLSKVVPADHDQLGIQYVTTALPANERAGRSVWAVVKKAGQWQKPVDWSNRETVVFCLSDPADRIEEVILVFTNDDKTAGRIVRPADLPPTLVASNFGCRGWKGTATYTASTAERNDPLTVTWSIEATAIDPADDPIQTEMRYAIKATGQWSVKGTVDDCSYSGSGSLTGDPSAPAMTFNFAPRESLAYRRGVFVVVAANPVIHYQEVCDGESDTIMAVVPNFPFLVEDALLSVDSSGVLIDGSKVAASDGVVFGTWKWRLQATD